MPRTILGFAGDTSIEIRVAAVTVSEVEPVMLPEVADTVVVPTESECARPLDAASLLMDATAPFDKLHVTAPVKSCVVLSEKIPVALNCCEVPRTILGFAGDTSIEISAGEISAGASSPPPHPHPDTNAVSNNAMKYSKKCFFIPVSSRRFSCQ